jgi:hypothetical protein
MRATPSATVKPRAFHQAANSPAVMLAPGSCPDMDAVVESKRPTLQVYTSTPRIEQFGCVRWQVCRTMGTSSDKRTGVCVCVMQDARSLTTAVKADSCVTTHVFHSARQLCTAVYSRQWIVGPKDLWPAQGLCGHRSTHGKDI